MTCPHYRVKEYQSGNDKVCEKTQRAWRYVSPQEARTTCLTDEHKNCVWFRIYSGIEDMSL